MSVMLRLRNPDVIQPFRKEQSRKITCSFQSCSERVEPRFPEIQSHFLDPVGSFLLLLLLGSKIHRTLKLQSQLFLRVPFIGITYTHIVHSMWLYLNSKLYLELDCHFSWLGSQYLNVLGIMGFQAEELALMPLRKSLHYWFQSCLKHKKLVLCYVPLFKTNHNWLLMLILIKQSAEGLSHLTPQHQEACVNIDNSSLQSRRLVPSHTALSDSPDSESKEVYPKSMLSSSRSACLSQGPSPKKPAFLGSVSLQVGSQTTRHIFP